MNAQGAKVLLAGAAAILLVPHTAQAQASDGIVLNILRECAKISDPASRLACFDNNIRSAGTAPTATASAPAASAPAASVAAPAPQGGSAPVASNTPQGFGADSMRSTRQRESREQRAAEGSLRAQVVSAREREPGIYLLTLDGGAQWLFAEGVSPNYRPPSRGSSVEIERGALGSFLLRFDGQPVIPVRRVQ